MKKIAVGDLGEFWYGDYKEPFEQLEGGIPGHPVGVVLKADDGKLLCAFCGKTYDNLGRHAHRHGMTAREYKSEVGLLQKTALVSEAQRRARIATGLRNIASGQITPGHVSNATDGRAVSQGRNSAEALNKTGRCYSQLLAVARSIQAESGRLTFHRLENRGITGRTLHRYFETISDLARQISGTTNKPRTRWTDEQLIFALRTLASKIGRTPSLSDLHRYGMPTTKVYIKRWGSYRAACEAVGLDPNLRSPGSTSPFDPAVLLTAYATTGNAGRAGTAVGASEGAVLNALHRFGFPFPPYYRGPGRREWAADMAKRLIGVAS